MSLVSGDLAWITGGHVKIGAASHLRRNLGVVFGVLALSAGIFGFTSYWPQKDSAKLAQLESFRSAYAAKCNAPSFRNDSPSRLGDLYLRSDRLQAAVEKQQAALSSGTPCQEVARALRSVDFPIALP
jgi:hypothetical protein